MSFQTEIGLLDQVDGSSTFEFATTKVITSVAGPLEITRMKNEKPTEAFLDISIKPATDVSSTRESFLVTKLAKVLQKTIDMDKYARREIQIMVQLLSPGESEEYTVKELTAIVNSVYLSLLNGGISLRTSFWATCCVIDGNGEILMRPTNKQLRQSVSHHIAVFSIKDGKSDALIFSDSKGSFSENELLKVLDRCCDDIDSFNSKVKKVVLDRVKRDYIWS
ncbi:hypothetical protein FOA43_000819 [Brettanomyces nanus]|uniref:Exoribonuclease phosphorolytic domain-containing protein n=1 Tax=Eeniella nana TaxID=13502 RepID=A0A875RXW9_EENNA|nr:uncharacterized protein FOA43_000819 [Brettanomyces nanus]QPG73508.1 hypothetical protein FOA43_000819 [Brettanomyces nanus]